MDIENIINGVNFKKICNVVVDVDSFNLSELSDSKNLIFCKTDLVGKLFDNLRGHNSKNILITHQSDFEINSELFKKKPSSIVKWFAQNVNHKDSNLIPIPIGIENHWGPSKGTLIDLNFIEKLQQDYSVKEKNTDKIYANFNVNNHPNRPIVKKFLLENNLVFLDTFGVSSKQFHENLSKFLFVASPRGNGIDCHRTWETLIMGSIPIVEKHFMYDTYQNLPIIQIESWSDLLNKSFLSSYVERYRNNELFNNMEELIMNYWFHKILEVYRFI
jgi:hypothetical protein